MTIYHQPSFAKWTRTILSIFDYMKLLISIYFHFFFRMNIFNLPSTEEAITFLQKIILPVRRLCQNDLKMKLYLDSENFWKCNKSTCCNKVCIRTETWFIGSRCFLLKLDAFSTAEGINVNQIKREGTGHQTTDCRGLKLLHERSLCHEPQPAAESENWRR